MDQRWEAAPGQLPCDRLPEDVPGRPRLLIEERAPIGVRVVGHEGQEAIVELGTEDPRRAHVTRLRNVARVERGTRARRPQHDHGTGLAVVVERSHGRQQSERVRKLLAAQLHRDHPLQRRQALIDLAAEQERTPARVVADVGIVAVATHKARIP